MSALRKRNEVADRALELVRKSLVCDLTLPWGQENENKEPTIRRWPASGFSFVSLTLALDWTSLADTVRSIAAERARFLSQPERYVLVESADDIERAKQEGRLAVGFHFQGTNPLEARLDMVEVYYRLGVRHMLLAYNETNAAGGGCHDPTDPGLTPFGVRLIEEMNRVGMLLDCSHTGHRTTMEALEVSRAPAIFSHSVPRGLHDHERNIRDDQIRLCAAKGGVIGVNGVGIFLGDNDATPRRLAEAIDYVANVVGPQHVALGLDYVYYMETLLARWRANPSRYPRGYPEPPWHFFEPEQLGELVEQLIRRNYEDAAIRGILGENFLRVCRAVWK